MSNQELTAHAAKHFRDVHFGGNWTTVCLQDLLKDVSWQQATQSYRGLNSILALTYHIHYYVGVVTKVLKGGALDGSDKLSFDHPPINNQDEWQAFQEKVLAAAEEMHQLIAQLSDDIFFTDFVDKKYGNYYRNIIGIVEHTHYHLGQIAIIKKLIQ